MFVNYLFFLDCSEFSFFLERNIVAIKLHPARKLCTSSDVDLSNQTEPRMESSYDNVLELMFRWPSKGSKNLSPKGYHTKIFSDQKGTAITTSIFFYLIRVKFESPIYQPVAMWKKTKFPEMKVQNPEFNKSFWK